MSRLLLFIVLFSTSVHSQSITTKISKAYTIFEKDSQLKNAIASLHIIDAKTGKVVFSKNATIGLAPASTQKIITSATAYEWLGKDFRYVTEFGYRLNGNSPADIFIAPSGDPTLGSWRWKNHSEDSVLSRIVTAIKNKGINSIGNFWVEDKGWEAELIPDGWIWQDVGNYYGAGAEVLNWRENQYDLYLKSGMIRGDAAVVTGTKPVVKNYTFQSFVTSAAKGSGDQSYIYLPLGNKLIQVRGTIPVAEEKFVISGSFPSPREQFIGTLVDTLEKKGVSYYKQNDKVEGGKMEIFHTERSPVLDSIVYWFLKKSINLYGEALIKTIAANAGDKAGISNGVKKLKAFWKEKGLAETELNMLDGSGLSPLNRVTTHAQAYILQYARTKTWFRGYLDAFPEFNGMKMKSGTINGAKSFCGYHTSKSGQEFIFSFIVNNYNGSAGSLVQKMYKILDVLK
jgi:serine-type D-Ala-D-Ala carboxypeptidase/endopeptidase (penicillin-binding protein 4)